MAAPIPLLPRESSDFSPIITIHNHVSITASPLAALTPVLKTTSWPSWNVYQPTATIYYRPEPDLQPQPPSYSATLRTIIASSPDFLSPGCKFTETQCPEAGVDKPQNIDIVAIEQIQTDDGREGYRIVWRLLDWTDWLMKCRRVHEFVDNGGGQTDYNVWTELGGSLAWILKWQGVQTMKDLFDKSLESLQKYVEAGGDGSN